MDEHKEQVDTAQEASSEELYGEILKEVAELTAELPSEEPVEIAPTEPAPVIVPFQARKKRKHRLLWGCLIGFLVLLVLAGGAFGYYYFHLRQPPAERVLISNSVLVLREGGSATLTCKVVPAKASQAVTWISSDSKVLTVDSHGNITVHSTGTCTVTAVTKNGTQAGCFVKVRPPLTVEEAALVGTWQRFATSEQGRIVYSYSDDFGFIFSEDRSGIFIEDGEEFPFQWEFDEALDGYCYYTVNLPNHRGAELKLNANTGDAMTNSLTLTLNDGRLWLFSIS